MIDAPNGISMTNRALPQELGKMPRMSYLESVLLHCAVQTKDGLAVLLLGDLEKGDAADRHGDSESVYVCACVCVGCSS